MRLYVILLSVLSIFSCKRPTEKIVYRYPSGHVMTKYIYPTKNDTANYLCRVYYESGNVKYQAQIAFNRFINYKSIYFENGNLRKLEELSQPVPFDAQFYDCHITNFRPDGSKESEYQYQHNKINGLSIDYDSTGKKTRSVEYINGKMNGIETLYYPNGKTKSIAFVKNDTLRGLNIYFNENGDTLKWFNNDEVVFYKKWLENGLVLTGEFSDSLHTNVIWKWTNRSNEIVKSKVISSNYGKYIAPE